MMTSPPDLEALLVALVLAPATYSRNRFFELYKDAGARRVRRRASLVRSIVRHLSPAGGADPSATVGSKATPSGRVELTYAVPRLGLRRTTTLDPIEAALVRYVMARGRSEGTEPSMPPAERADRERIEDVLRRLAPVTASHVQEGDRGPAMEHDPIA